MPGNNQPVNISDRETLESLKLLAKILLAFSLSESSDPKVINLNPTPEKLAA
jgi:hypothetical protein